jgi:hypothetical protein
VRQSKEEASRAKEEASISKVDISTADVLLSSPSTLMKHRHRSRPNLEGTKVKTCREPIIRTARQDLSEKVSDHVFRDAEMQDNITVDDHASYQMVSNFDMPNLAHPLTIGRNAQAGLGVSVNRIGFRAKKTQKTKHVLHMNQLLTAYTGSNKFRRASRIHIRSLWQRAPHDWSAVHVNCEARDTDLQKTDSEGGIRICNNGEALGDRERRGLDVHVLVGLSEVENEISLGGMSRKGRRIRRQSHRRINGNRRRRD